jgi:hypothetical protein
VRNGARALLTQAVEAAALVGRHADKITEDGRRRLVPRSPSSTMRIFSSAEYCRRV